jgi:predicted MPP superfamily phosphohydrolase
LILVVLLALLGHGYVWVAVVNRLHGSPWSRAAVDWATNSCILSFLVLPILVGLRWQAEGIGSFEFSYSTTGPIKCYFYGCALWGVMKLVLAALGDRQRDNPDTLLSTQQQLSPLTAELGSEVYQTSFARFLSCVPGNQSLQLCVDHKKLRIPRLHPRHEGLRIAHISDLHMTGNLGLPLFESVARQVNRLEPDVIAITGDIVENSACQPWLLDTLATMRANYGVYFVLGNHDYYIDSHKTLHLLSEAGLNYLSGTWMETEWQEAPVVLTGNELPWQSGAESVPSLPPRNDEDLPLRIALMHSPDQFEWAVQHGIDLALAGHTHGGQVRLPLLGPIASPSLYGTRYASGVFRRGKTVMHVSRGISGKFPIRWNCPPEIALLELVSS